ncbi:exonuclease SbcCD subunit D C-terminal domain-containing protein [Tistrella sp. BH-R2-4]|uniref:Nuclease SbcCD subunit D n=1 Tax=Tistrella arctica TaxID=3133430 RepID=A0ABU9YQG6_9PROT
MHILHTADWHLGQELHGFERGAEHDRFLDWLARTITDQAVDALVVAGDVYDTVNPPVAAQTRLYRFLNDVLNRNPGLQVVIVGGNHDGPTRLELPAPLLDARRVTILGAIPRQDGRPAPEHCLVPLTDAGGRIGAVVAAIAYPRPGDLPVDGGGGAALGQLYQAALAAATSRFPGRPVIATGHLHVAGATVSETSERPVMIGGEEAISAGIFPAGLAYVALGHLHRAQTVAAGTVVRYAGSPFPMSMAERDYRHSVVLVTLAPDTPPDIDLIEIPRPVTFLRIPADGALAPDDAIAALTALDIAPVPERAELRPFLEVVVRLEAPAPDLRRRLDAALDGKPVRLARVRSLHAGAGGTLGDDTAAMAGLDEISPAEVFARLHRQRFETDPPSALIDGFRQLLADVAAGDDQDDLVVNTAGHEVPR